MSITDELRKYANRFKNSHDAWSGIGDDLTAIADRIDAEHERMLGDWDYWESTHIELPKDADGEPIHVGDVMEPNGANSLFGQASFEVRAMRYDEGGWEVYDRLGDRYAPSLLRHYHAPTVEDVLCDLLNEYRENECTLEEARLSEYAKRLTLTERKD